MDRGERCPYFGWIAASLPLLAMTGCGGCGGRIAPSLALLAMTVFGVMVRVEGIEPSTQAWEARVLPLNYTRIRM